MIWWIIGAGVLLLYVWVFCAVKVAAKADRDWERLVAEANERDRLK